MVTAEVITRVLNIRCGDRSVGTAFTYDFHGHQFVITARHVVQSGAPVEVFRAGHWEDAHLALIWELPAADVAVFVGPSRFPHDLACPYESGGITYGQSAYILGYPLTLQGGAPPSGYPIPLVRRCTLSWIGENDAGATLFVLDGLATPGFSGGPLAFRPAENPAAPFKIGGVVLGFFPEVLSVEYRGRDPNEAPTLTVHANSGLMMCAAIEQVLAGIATVA